MLNIHGTALLAGDRGLLIVGPSGAGKTTLALALIERFSLRGKFSRLVGDDRLFVENRGGRLVAHAPPAIAGLAEIPGLGPRPVTHEPVAVIDLCIRMVPAAEMQRFQEPAREDIAGCCVPAIAVAARNIIAALPVVVTGLRNLSFRPD